MNEELRAKVALFKAASDRWHQELSDLFEDAEETGNYYRADERGADLAQEAWGLLDALLDELTKEEES